MPLYQQKAIKTGRMEHQGTKLTSMRPRLQELNDNPYIWNIVQRYVEPFPNYNVHYDHCCALFRVKQWMD